MKERATWRFLEATAVFFFTLQAIWVLFSVLFGVIYDVVVTGPMTPMVIVIHLLLLLAFPPTSPSEFPQERIDYVWIRGLSAVDAQVLDSTASDHRMVIIEIRLE